MIIQMNSIKTKQFPFIVIAIIFSIIITASLGVFSISIGIGDIDQRITSDVLPGEK